MLGRLSVQCGRVIRKSQHQDLFIRIVIGELESHPPQYVLNRHEVGVIDVTLALCNVTLMGGYFAKGAWPVASSMAVIPKLQMSAL